MANEEIDPEVDEELDDQEAWYSDDPAEKKVSFQTKIRAFVPVVVLIAAAVFYLPTTVGGKITLSSDQGIEFGQSASEIVTCAGTPINLTITPFSTFTNASDSGTHYFKSVKVSGIPAQCVGIDFKIRAFDNSSSNPLAIFDTNNTVAVVRVISTSSYSAGTGSYGTTVSSAAGSFTTSFDSPVAVSTSVSKLTIETGPQYVLNQTIPCGSAGTFTIVNNILTSSSTSPNCSGTITIPVGVTSIGTSAFANKSVSGSILLPNGITTIGASAFYRAGPGSVRIPSSVTSLTNSVFWESAFSSITFEGTTSLTTIPDSTFRYMSNLTSFTLPDEITTLGNLVFATTPLATTPFTNTSRLTNLGTNTFQGAQFTSFVIPNGVTSVASNVFGTPKLKRLTIPSGVTTFSDPLTSAPLLNCIIYSGSNLASKRFQDTYTVVSDIASCPP
jgi:hypothetical protein